MPRESVFDALSDELLRCLYRLESQLVSSETIREARLRQGILIKEPYLVLPIKSLSLAELMKRV